MLSRESGPHKHDTTAFYRAGNPVDPCGHSLFRSRDRSAQRHDKVHHHMRCVCYEDHNFAFLTVVYVTFEDLSSRLCRV